MKIVLISCVFAPEPVISAQTSADVASGLDASGNLAVVISSFPNRPTPNLYPKFHRSLLSLSKNEPPGYPILRLFSTFSPTSTLFSRWMENITFGISSSIALLVLQKPDVIYANTWPVFAQGLVCLVARLRRIPLVLSIQDVYPESLLIQNRVQKSSWAYKILRSLDRWNAHACHSLIVISSGFAETYIQDRQVPAERVHLIPNWIDGEKIPVYPRELHRQQYGLPQDAFWVVYGGNVGVAAGVEKVVESFARLKETKIHLLIAGDGDRRKTCEELAAGQNIPTVHFHHPWPSEETAETLSCADVLILPTQGRQSLASVPSKLMTYMMSARPVLAMVLAESETAAVIAQSGCGWVIPPDRPDLLAEKLMEISQLSEEERSARGAAGRTYAMEHFTKEACLPRVMDVLMKAAQCAQ